MRIALVPLYVDYYESAVPGIRQAKQALLDKVLTVIGPGHGVILFDRVTDVEMARTARQRLREEQPDCIVVLPLVAVFSRLADEVMKGWKGPLVLLSAMAGTSIPKPATMTKVVAESQSFGSQAISNAWFRQGLKFHVLHQIPGTEEGDAAIQALLRAIEASQQLRTLRMGLIGEVFDGMTDILLPAREFSARTGARLIKIPMKRVHRLMEQITTRELLSFEKRLATAFVFGRFSEKEKVFSFRATLAIQELIKEERLDCAAFNSHGPEGLKSKKLGVMCALGVTLGTSSGCPMSEVGDLCTAFAMWLGRKLGGASYYTELDSAYISEREWLLLNSGEYDLAWLRKNSKPHLLRNTNFAGVNGRGVSVCAPLREGPATIINFSPTPKGANPYRIQFTEGSISRAWSPEMGVGNARFHVAGDAHSCYERWLAAGPVHHSVTSPGHLGSEIGTFCKLVNWTCLEIS